MKKKKFSRRDLLKMLGATAAVGAVGGLGKEVVEAVDEREKRKELERIKAEKEKLKVEELKRKAEEAAETKEEFEAVEPHEFFDTNPDFLSPVTSQDGEWSKEQIVARRRTLANGEEIFDDVGMSFYLVKKGDTISEIRAGLSGYPEFAYLANQTYKLESFNIPSKKLRAGKWIPIPLESKDRRLTEAQFVSYANTAIEEMRSNELYGPEIERVLQKINLRELVATMVAIAKQEGGGLPLGQFSLHRYESHKRTFSYSYFHVLMRGPGEEARQTLNLTKGQTCHPINAVKLFLAFMIEKTGERRRYVDRYFPISEHENEFAEFYNGRRWKKTNPDYLNNFWTYHREADAQLSEDGLRWKKEIETEPDE